MSVIVVLALQALSGCTSMIDNLTFHLIKKSIPLPDGISLNPDARKGDFVVYKTAQGATSLYQLIDKDENGTVLIIRTAGTEPQRYSRLSIATAISGMELHLDVDGILHDAYLVYADGTRRRLNVENRPPAQQGNVMLLKYSREAYRVKTGAGEFSCSMLVFRERDGYKIRFVSAGILLSNVRSCFLTGEEFEKFNAFGVPEKESYSGHDCVELVEWGNGTHP
jgi:hypothetical protein